MNNEERVCMDDDVVYLGRMHWVLFTGPVLLLLFALVLAFTVRDTPLHSMPLFFTVFSFAWGVMVWVNYRFSSLTIKKKQVIFRTGLLVRQTVDISLVRIESIDIRQSLLGSLLQYGSLVITGTGGSRQVIDYIAKPLTCRRHIEQLMNN